MNFFSKLFSVLSGIVFTFLFLELILRIMAFGNQLSTTRSVVDPSTYKIICIGNSHTYGEGVLKEQAYPALLEKILNNSKSFHKKFTVYNLGKLGANSSVLLDTLPQEINELKPNLMIILTGEPNYWTWYGYDRFLKDIDKNKNQIPNDSIKFTLLSLFNNSKTFKLFEILLRKKQTEMPFNSYNQLEKAMYLRTLAENKEMELSLEDAKSGVIALAKSISTFSPDNPKNVRDYYYALYFLYFYKLNNVKLALDIVEKSIILNNHFDYLSYTFLNNIKNSHNITIKDEKIKIDKLLQQASKSLPDQNKMKVLDELTNQIENPNYKLEDLRFAREILPGNSFLIKKLWELSAQYTKENEIINTQELITDLKMQGPFSKVHDYLSEKLKFINTKTTNPYIYTLTNEFSRYNLDSFPSLHASQSSKSDKEIQNWLIYDIKKMIEIAQRENIKVIVMNYHWLKGNPKEEYIADAAKIAAKQTHSFFSDTHFHFMNEVHNLKLNDSEFFAHKYGEHDNHPSVLGHQIIAKNLYQDILKFKIIE